MSLSDINRDVKSATSHPPWYIYESQLSTVVVGAPLWKPGPYEEEDGSLSPIRLADVGYMFQKGRFVTLFNAAEVCPSILASGHDLFPQEKLRNPLIDTSTEDWLSSLSVHPRVTKIGSDMDTGNVQILANLSSTDTGAAMILPGPDGTARMKSFDLRDKPFYSDYGFAHCESWLQAAAHTAAKHVQLRDLIFVTGIDMVNAWALFAFSSSSDLCSVNITTGPTTMRAIRQDSPPSASFNCPPIMNYGPVDRRERGSLDQCVVIRRFKMHRRIDKLWWQMNKGLRKVLVKRTEVPNTKVIDGASEPEHANGEDAENVIGGSETEDKKSQRRKRTQTKPTPESPIEDSDLQGDRRDGDGGGPGPGGAGGAGSSGTDVSSSRGLPPGNSGGRRDTGSGNSATGGGNGQGRNVSRYALKDDGVPSLTNGDVSVTPEWSTCEFDDNSSNDSEDGYVDYERLEPLDALLEYILEACPSADYAGAGDHDLTSLRPLLYDWDTFPARLRTEKPEVHLQSNGLALLKDSVYYRTLVLHDLRQADLDEFTASFQSQLHAEDSKETESPKSSSAAIERPYLQTDLDELTASFQSQLHAEDSEETESPKTFSIAIEQPYLQIYWSMEWNNHVQLIDGHTRNVTWQAFQNPPNSGPWSAIVYYRELEYGRGSSATLRGAKHAASQDAMKKMCPEKHDAIIYQASRMD